MSFDNVREHMQRAGLDGLIATSYENVAYLGGVPIMTQRSIPERLAAVILPLNGEPAFVICSIEEAQVRAGTRIPDLRTYVEFVTSPTEPIAQAVREMGLANCRLGLELKVLSAHYYQELTTQLPAATFVAADGQFDEIRAVKTAEETDILQRAALATDRAIYDAFVSGRLGGTDKEIADHLAQGIQASGADSVAFLVLGAGANASMAHPYASNLTLREGDIVRCDVGGHYGGYYSDLARTSVVGPARSEQVDIYQRLWEIHEETIAAARPGVRAKDVYLTCQAAFERLGLPMNMPHVGHSLGLGLHEPPMLHPSNETVLTEGMVLAIEPLCRVNGGPIFHVEDLLVLTAGGNRILSRSVDWSHLLVIGS
jgi:Xaa-Pro dipeptidase